MSDPIEQIDTLLDQADDLEDGPAEIAILQEAVRLADLANDLDLGFQTRLRLIDAACFGGQPDVMLVAFSWCLSRSDQDPQQFPEGSLLWKYKWVVGNTTDFPQVSRQQIDDMLADLARRYQRAGSTLYAVHDLREALAMDMGDRKAAVAAHRQVLRTRRDSLSDCAACVLDGKIDYLLFLGRSQQAVDLSGPIVDGRLRCNTVPHRTLAKLLLPLLRLVRVEEAMEHHRKGYRLIARDPDFMTAFGQHITFLTLTDNLARAVQLFEKHLPPALTTVNQGGRFEFLLAGLLLFQRLAEQGKEALELRLPASLVLPNNSGRYPVVSVRDWLAEQTADLASRFDARNGNDYFSRRIRNLRQLKKLVKPCPFSGKANP